MSPKKSLPFANIIYSRFIASLEDELDTSEHSSLEPVSRRTSINLKQAHTLNRDENVDTQQDQLAKRSSSSSNQQKKRPNIRKYVSFSKIEIRHYNVTLGKHLCEHDFGPSITLDWSYEDESRLALNDYENHRHTLRRDRDNVVAMSRREREERLQAVGFDIRKIDKVACRRHSLQCMMSSSNLTQKQEQRQEQQRQTVEDVPLEF